MQQTVGSLVGYLGDIGLFSAIVGFAVILLMPDRIGHQFGVRLAILGGIAMAYELALRSAV